MERRRFLHAGLATAALATLPRRGLADPLAGLFRVRASDDGPLRLNSNENPLGIAPSARAAIVDKLVDANRYPGREKRALVSRIAAMHGVQPENVVMGNGSAEVLQMAVQMLAAPGTRVVIPDPTFEQVEGYAMPYRKELHLVKMPLAPDYAHDLDRMADAARKGRGAVLVYVCNPNNPTGSITPTAAVDDWIASAPENVWFLVDEAYFHFVDAPGYESALRWITRKPNVIVARTFSKIYGMAGMRLGYGIAHADTIKKLDAFAADSNTNILALAAADASLDDHAYLRQARQANDEGRRILCDALEEMGIPYIPSQANFVMYQVGDTGTFQKRMRERDIWVGRPFPPMLEYNRTSIGTPEQMHRFVEVLEDFRTRGWV
ncbi:MAG: histidinol-phosphate transaminase [Gemmatimonadota bacterium]